MSDDMKPDPFRVYICTACGHHAQAKDWRDGACPQCRTPMHAATAEAMDHVEAVTKVRWLPMSDMFLASCGLTIEHSCMDASLSELCREIGDAVERFATRCEEHVDAGHGGCTAAVGADRPPDAPEPRP